MKNWTMELNRMAAMLSRFGGRGYSVAESSVAYLTKPVAVDPDSDFDFDPEDEKPQPAATRNALTRVREP